jgi:hypothetical protein
MHARAYPLLIFVTKINKKNYKKVYYIQSCIYIQSILYTITGIALHFLHTQL